ncbi:MAG: VWA domain-containing protein [Duncaniella sp.]|nr:VWA domain-containing protein [Duncaniella sp.]
MNILNLFKKHNHTIESPVAEASEAKPEASEAKSEASTSETKTGPQPQSKRVHNLIVLDESGSMQSIYAPALSGVNETLQTIRQAQIDHPNQTHFVTLVSFNTSRYNEIYSDTPAAEATDITAKHYQPAACTPLYDAMGRSMTTLRSKVEEGDIVLVTVITDGYENASTEYDGKAIKSLIDSLKHCGWVFTYIGANQDVEKVAESMSIDNHLSFEADDEGTKEMWNKESSSRKRFFSKLDVEPLSSICGNYFDDPS